MIDVGLLSTPDWCRPGASGRQSPDSRDRAPRRPAPRRCRARRSRAGGPGSSSPPPRCSRRFSSDNRDSSCASECRAFPSRTCPPADRRARIERDNLRLARLRNRKSRHELGRAACRSARASSSSPSRIAGHQHVAAERLAIEEHAARQPERRIEIALEGGLEPGRCRRQDRAAGPWPPGCTASSAIAATGCRHSR